MVKKYICLLVLVFMVSCGGSSSTDAGKAEVVYLEEIEDFDRNDQSSSFAHSKIGFYKDADHQWGFENSSGSDKRNPAHISFEYDGDGYAEWYIQWEENDFTGDETFYICDPQNENLSNNNMNLGPIGLDDECVINEDEVNNLQKMCGKISVKKYNNYYSQLGICKSAYDNNPPSLLAVLQLHPYQMERFEIYDIHYGGSASASFEDRANEVFHQGVVNISLTEKIFNRKDVNENYDYSDIPNREDLFFIGAGKIGSPCYNNIPDDIDIIKNYINSTLFSDNFVGNPGRAMVWIGKYGVRYWTFDVSKNPCYTELISFPDRVHGTEYYIGTINSQKGINCRFDDNVNQRKIRYNKAEGAWEISNTFNDSEWSFDLSEIDPDCHIFYDPSDKDDKMIWTRHISTTSRATTKNVGSGLVAFARENDNIVMLHEMGHLLNLSDIEFEGNLMNYFDEANAGQHLRFSEVKARENDQSESFDKAEYQWDCLHDISKCAYPF
jgi:hypothetical protein